MRKILFILACSGFASGALAQVAAPTVPVTGPMPLQVASPAPANATVLPANTEVTLAMNDTLTTKGKRYNEGDTFDLSVTHDVMLGQYVIIPRGARAVGRITWMTSKGMFGKSGKMEIDIEYVEVSGRRIPLKGNFRQEGEGNTVATVGAVIAAPVIGFFVTGKSGVIPKGRELVAFTKDDLPVALPGPLVASPLPVQPIAPVQPVGAAEPAPAGLKSDARVKCATCN